MASGVTDVVRESTTGRLACGEDGPPDADEWSDDVDGRDGAIDISSSCLWWELIPTIPSLSEIFPLPLLPKSCSSVVEGEGAPSSLTFFVPESRGSS